MAAFFLNVPQVTGDDWLGEGDSAKELFTAWIFGLLAAFFTIATCVSWGSVCLRCCCVLCCSTPVTLVAAIVLILGGMAGEQVNRTIDLVCGEYTNEI